MFYRCLILFALLCSACGVRETVKTGPDLCQMAISSLKQQLGPELGQVEAKARVVRPERAAHGCLVVYSRVAEELPEEMSEDDDIDLDVDHRLAVIVDPDRGPPQFRKIPNSDPSPGPVKVKLSLKDVTGDGVADFIIEEQAPLPGETIGYRGLRIFLGGADENAQEIYSSELTFKTPEGLRIIPRWQTKTLRGHHLFEMTGGGQTKLFRYNRTLRRFDLVENNSGPAPKAAPSVAPTAPTESTADSTGVRTNKASAAKRQAKTGASQGSTKASQPNETAGGPSTKPSGAAQPPKKSPRRGQVAPRKKATKKLKPSATKMKTPKVAEEDEDLMPLL